MKKQLLFTLFVVYILLQSGCKKQKEEIPEDDLGKQPDKVEEVIIEGVVAKEGRIAFSSLDFYESMFEEENESSLDNLIISSNEASSYVSAYRFSNDPSAKSRYASMRVSGTDETLVDSEEIDSEFLTSILNPDGLVQIGQWVMRLDFNSNMVYALPESMLDDEGYTALFNGDSSKCATYSMDEEVIYGLMEYEAENPEPIEGNIAAKVSFWKWVCSDGRAKMPDGVPILIKPVDQTVYSTDPRYKFRVKMKRGYQAAGVYFRLFQKIKQVYMNSHSNIYWYNHLGGDVQMTVPAFVATRVRCGQRIHTHAGAGAGLWEYTGSDTVVKNHYQGPSALRAFYLESINFRYKSNFGGDDWQVHTGHSVQWGTY